MSSLGDVIHTLPLVSILKRGLPNSTIDWVVNEEYTILLEGNPYISEVIPFKRKDWLSWKGFFKNIIEIKRFAMNLKRKHYDLVIDVQGLFKSALVVAMASGKKTIGFSNAREFASFFYDVKIYGNYNLHAVERYLQIAEMLNLSWEKKDLEFNVPSKEDDKKRLLEKLGNLKDRKLVVFSPFSRWQTKLWDEKKFQELEELLKKENYEVVWVGSPEEKLSIKVKNNFVGKLDLLELYELMKLSSFVITCDSGAMHIASAADANIFAFFGPTSPKRTGPYTIKGKSFIIKKDGVECAPCFSKTCKYSTKECLNIEPQEIFNIIKKSGII